MKTRFKVLDVNHIIEEVTEHFNCTHSSYTESCVVKNLETGEIITIHKDKITNDIEAQILEKVDNGDMICGDEFRI